MLEFHSLLVSCGFICPLLSLQYVCINWQCSLDRLWIVVIIASGKCVYRLVLVCTVAMMKYSDQRTKILQQALNGIQLIKSANMESSFKSA